MTYLCLLTKYFIKTTMITLHFEDDEKIEPFLDKFNYIGRHL